MPVQKRPRLVNNGGRINYHKELIEAHEGWRRAIIALAAAHEKITHLKLELMKYRGF